eukprot:TRINITY_DN16294_c0_g1_i1.p1 TRINITY_DN16294_c0_g1~~TRINITY_DN16294_c0_g1_i1.p1  ORF type:complete len:71 (-),score=13.09 TRINITY_DN16294_c0_g1_i1:58-270(-)
MAEDLSALRKEDDTLVDQVVQKLQDFCPVLKLYESYVKNYENSIKCLNKLRGHAAFAKFFGVCAGGKSCT